MKKLVKFALASVVAVSFNLQYCTASDRFDFQRGRQQLPGLAERAAGNDAASVVAAADGAIGAPANVSAANAMVAHAEFPKAPALAVFAVAEATSLNAAAVAGEEARAGITPSRYGNWNAALRDQAADARATQSVIATVRASNFEADQTNAKFRISGLRDPTPASGDAVATRAEILVNAAGVASAQVE